MRGASDDKRSRGDCEPTVLPDAMPAVTGTASVYDL